MRTLSITKTKKDTRNCDIRQKKNRNKKKKKLLWQYQQKRHTAESSENIKVIRE